MVLLPAPARSTITFGVVIRRSAGSAPRSRAAGCSPATTPRARKLPGNGSSRSSTSPRVRLTRAHSPTVTPSGLSMNSRTTGCRGLPTTSSFTHSKPSGLELGYDHLLEFAFCHESARRRMETNRTAIKKWAAPPTGQHTRNTREFLAHRPRKRKRLGRTPHGECRSMSPRDLQAPYRPRVLCDHGPRPGTRGPRSATLAARSRVALATPTDSAGRRRYL